MHTLLVLAGVDGKATLVPLEPGPAVDALVAGEVDAIATWAPHASRAERRLGAANRVELGSEVYSEQSVLAVKNAGLAAHRPALVRLVGALADAERLVRERPVEAFAALRGEFPEVDEAEFREEWSRIELGLGVTHTLAATLEREADWFRTTGRSPGPPLDVAALLAPDVLAEVDEEAVTFVAARRGGGR